MIKSLVLNATANHVVEASAHLRILGRQPYLLELKYEYTLHSLLR